MEILGIGPGELILFFVLALVILGPKGMADLGHKVGRFIREFIRSPLWKDITTAQREVRDLPQKLVREAGLEEVQAAIRQTTQETNQTIMEVKREAQLPAEIPSIAPEKTAADAPTIESGEPPGTPPPDLNNPQP